MHIYVYARKRSWTQQKNYNDMKLLLNFWHIEDKVQAIYPSAEF